MTSRLTKICLMWLLVVITSAHGAEASKNIGSTVEFSGCELVFDGPTCLLGESRSLSLWISVGTEQSVTAKFDEQSVALVNSNIVQGGRHFQLDVPPNTDTLVVAVEDEEHIIFFSSINRPPELANALSLARQGNHQEVIDTMDLILATAQNEWLGVALRRKAQSLRALGRQELADQNLQLAVEADLHADLIGEATRSATALAYSVLQNGREFDRARQLLLDLPSPVEGDAQSRYFIDYYLGLVSLNSGDTRSAMTHLSTAAAQARRINNFAYRSFAESMLAVQLQRLGRRQSAQEILRTLVNDMPSDMPHCTQSKHLNNLAWADLLTLEAGESEVSTELTTDLLNQSYELKRTHCPSNDQVNTLVNLALVHLFADDIATAENYATQAREENNLNGNVVGWHLNSWLLEIEARIALSTTDYSTANDRYLQLERIADAALSPSTQWRATVGQAKVQRASGDLSSALALYEKAQAILAQSVFLVPLDAGRDTLLSSRHAATRAHLDLLLSMDRDADAFQLARSTRSQMLRTLAISEQISNLDTKARLKWESALAQYQTIRKEMEAQSAQAWSLAADQLAEFADKQRASRQQMRGLIDQAANALNLTSSNATKTAYWPAGETMVLIEQLDAGWVVFTHDSNVLNTYQPNCNSGDQTRLATCLLSPVVSQLSDVSVLRILPTGLLKNVDFHSLVFDNEPLGSSFAVVYGVDLASRSAPLPTTGRAILVADGRGDLAAAREEFETVQEKLNNTTWQVEPLSGSKAHASVVLPLLEEAQLFHFAGHARYVGELGWASELVLADESSISITDILTLNKPPKLVILSGCETARSSAEVQPESIGLANAFLTAGTQTVLATSRPVRDDTARLLIENFYHHWTQGLAPHEALRLAQREVRTQQPEADWAAYRLINR